MTRLTHVLKFFFTKPEYVFVVPALLFSLLSAILMPQLIVNDENMHFIRSYELTELETGHQCSLPVDIKQRGFYDIYSGTKPDYSFENSLVNQSDEMQTDCGTASSYNPLLHAPQAVGVEIAKLVWPTTGGMILLGRIVNALIYCLGFFFIIKKARIGKWLLVIVGLLPMMIHMAGSLSGDVINNLIVIGFITFVFNLFVQKTVMTRRQVVALVTLAALLAVTKLPNLVLMLPILFLPSRVLPRLRIKNKTLPVHAIRFAIGIVCGFAAIAVVVAWMKLYDAPFAGAIATENPVTKNPIKFVDILFNTYINPFTNFAGTIYSDWLLRGVFGSFASFRYHLPFSVVMILAGLFVMIALRKDNVEQNLLKNNLKPLAISTLVALVIIIAAITYGLYTAWAITSVGLGQDAKFALGLQGRYFTPLLLLLTPLFIGLRHYISVTIKPGVTTGVMIFTVMCGSLIFYLVQTVRYAMELGLV